ncbi:sulfite exporter TauE/SafE family protein [Cytobacillus firmus]|uniref:sulfite exporter TauE/SafE family protein n=1 Tax=Cytobacillus firmus TaxID=1399 RepID=UPI0034A17503
MEIFIYILIILIASILQTSTGFGFSILATPFLLLLFEPKEAIQINLILSLIISAALFSTIKKDTDFGVLKRFAIGSAGGLPTGIAIFLFLDISRLKIAVSFIILLLTIFLMANFRVKETSRRDYSVGGLSGIMTTSIGMPGPPLLLYFSGTDTEKERLRGTTLAFYLFIYSASLVFQIIFAGTNKTIWLSSLYALPLVLLGLYLGQILFVKINQRFFKIFTYIILIFTGVYLLAASVE